MSAHAANALVVDGGVLPASRDERTRLDVRDLWVAGSWSVIYFASTLFLAHRRVLWTDELVTLAIARLPNIDALWQAVLTGGDTLPPLGHYLTHVALQLVPDEGIAVRLPAVLGYWVMSASIFVLLRRYAGRVASTIAAILPATTLAFGYAYEGRPYGLMLGWSALALLSWDRLNHRRRTSWLVVLLVAMVGATCSHWYGILIAPALVCGEAARTITRRRFDWAAASAIIAGALLPIALLLPVIRHAQEFGVAMRSTSAFGLSAITDVYGSLIGSSALTLFLLLCVVGSGALRSSEGRRIWPTETMVAAAVLALLPVWSALPASLFTGVYEARYLLPAVVGLVVVLGLVLDRALDDRRFAQVAAVTVAVAMGFTSLYQHKQRLLETSSVTKHEGVFSLLGCAPALVKGLPIVVPDVHAYYSLHHYAGDGLRDRLVYVTEYNALGARMSNKMEQWTSWHFIDYPKLRSLNGEFFIYDGQLFSSQARSELVPRLLADGFQLEDAGCGEPRDTYPRSGHLYRVRATGSAAPK